MRVLAVPITTLLACSVLAAPASAQSIRRLEIGAQFSATRLAGVDITDSGVGGWAGWTLSDIVALEASGDVFPAGKGDVTRGGRKFQALFGPRLTWQLGRVGVFARPRVGVARIGEGQSIDGGCIAVFPPPDACYTAETRVVTELGGGLDLRTSERTSVRFDVGSMVSFLNDRSVRYSANNDYPNDLRFSAGMGFRF